MKPLMEQRRVRRYVRVGRNCGGGERRVEVLWASSGKSWNVR